MKTPLVLPDLLRALGDEVRALQGYYAHDLITQEEADERLAELQLFYPPGWYEIETLVDTRHHQPLPQKRYAEAAE